MKKKLNPIAIAAAACLTLGGVAQAGSMGYPEGYSATEIETHPTYVETQPTIIQRRTVVTSQPMVVERQPTIVERRVVTRRPAYVERRVVARRPAVVVERDEPSFGERVVSWPGRAARTVVRTPVIVGETLAGRREIVSDRGLFARDRDRVIYRDDDFRTRRTVRRLSSRPISRTEYIARRTGNTLERGAESAGRGLVRTGRTIVRTPVIVGETLTGEREIINEEGRPFAR